MAAYLIKRLLLIFPTMLGIMLISFAIIQFAPGGPIERVIAQISGTDVSATARVGGGTGDGLSGGNAGSAAGADTSSKYRGAQGLDPEFIKSLEKQFGFDKPTHERFFLMMKNFLLFDFGKSYFRDVSVLQLIGEKLPVSVSLGLWMTLITYFISIPLGIRKAVHDGEKFDTRTSSLLVFGYAIPGFLIAVLLLVLFAGGSFVQWFPSRGLTAASWRELPQFLREMYPEGAALGNPSGWLPFYWRWFDYAWHLILPLIAMALGSFTTMTFLTKNSFLDEIRKQYVTTARAKGLGQSRILYGHVFRNAMLLIIAGFPGAFVHAFFSGSLLIEKIFSLDGLGLLSWESVINRDYPVVFANLYIFALLGLVVHLISDFMYTLIDPRIDFESREV